MLGNLRATKKIIPHTTPLTRARGESLQNFYFERGMWGDEADRQMGWDGNESGKKPYFIGKG